MVKTKFIIIILAFLLSIKLVKAQDQCPNFKLERKKNQLTFIPKFKVKEVHIKVMPAIIIGAMPSFKTQTTKIDNNDTSITNSSSRGNTNMQGTYGGYLLQFCLEKKIRKKSTLEYSIAFENLYRYSYPDTTIFNYPTVNMKKYYGSLGNDTRENYDEIESNNIRLGLQYRYYLFKKVYSGLYLGPQCMISLGQNKYHDFDENLNNVNSKFKQNNVVLNLGAIMGYQFIIKKHFVIDLTSGIVFKQGFNFERKYSNSEANDANLKTKYPNTSALNQKYSPAFYLGLGIGYKFL